MATKKLDSRIQNKYDTEQNWTTNNPVLLNGELIIVSKEDGTIGFKVGDGVKKYSELSWVTLSLSDQKKIEGTDGQVIVKEGTIPGEVKAIDAPWLPIAGGTYENMTTPFVLNMSDNNTAGSKTYQAVLGFANDSGKYSSFALGTQNSSGLSQVLGQSQIETNKFVKVDLLAQDGGHETVLRVLTTGGTGKIMVSDPIEPFSSDGSVRIQSQSGDYCIQVQNEGISLETNGVVLGINESQLIITDGATNAYNINGNANGLEITGLKEPKEYNQPATKQYVDNLIGSGGSNYSKSKTSSFNKAPTSASGNPSGYQYYIDETVSGMTSSINPLVFPNWSTLSDMTTYQDDWNKITAIESKDNILRFYFADSASVNIKYIVYY